MINHGVRWRSIAVHVEAGSAAERRIDTAIFLAQCFGAQLRGVCVETPHTDVDAMPAAHWAHPTLAGAVGRSIIGERFLSRCKAFGVDNSELSFQTGLVVPALVLAAHAADLLVVTQPDALIRSGQLRAEDLEVILRLAARPLLILPRTWDDALLTRRVLVGWDGGGPCARAVADALPLLRWAEDVQVIRLMDPHPTTAVADWWPPLRDWLQRQDVVAESRTVVRDRQIEHQLQRLAEQLDPDLIVMGAYGKETWRAPWIGRDTRAMLNATVVPLLISH